MPIPEQHPVLTDGVVTLRAPRPDDVQGQIDRNREDPARDDEDARRWITFGISEAWAAGWRLAFVVELNFLNGRARFPGYKISSLLRYDD